MRSSVVTCLLFSFGFILDFFTPFNLFLFLVLSSISLILASITRLCILEFLFDDTFWNSHTFRAPVIIFRFLILRLCAVSSPLFILSCHFTCDVLHIETHGFLFFILTLFVFIFFLALPLLSLFLTLGTGFRSYVTTIFLY